MYGAANRLQAVAILRNLRWQRFIQPVAAFAHEVCRLVTLAYPNFDEDAAAVIARDVFLEGLEPAFQVTLRSSKETSSASVMDLAEEVKRLQLAGVGDAAIPSQSAACGHDQERLRHLGFSTQI